MRNRAGLLLLVLPLVMAPVLHAEGEITDDLHYTAPLSPEGTGVVEAAPTQPQPQNTARYSTNYWTNNQHYGWNSGNEYYGNQGYQQLEQRYYNVDMALYRLAVAYRQGTWQANQVNRIRVNGRTIYNRYRYNANRNDAWSLETWLNFYESYLRSYGYLNTWNYPTGNRTTYYTNPQVWNGDDTNRRYYDSQASTTFPDYSRQRVTSNIYWGDYGQAASTYTRAPGPSTGGDLEFRLAPELTGNEPTLSQ